MSLHIMFYPNVYLPLTEAWKNMFFSFGNGLLSQYIAIHVDDNRKQLETHKEEEKYY